MKKTGLLLVSAAPGAALGYALLMGYLQPVPITLLPRETSPARKRRRQAVPA